MAALLAVGAATAAAAGPGGTPWGRAAPAAPGAGAAAGAAADGRADGWASAEEGAGEGGEGAGAPGAGGVRADGAVVPVSDAGVPRIGKGWPVAGAGRVRPVLERGFEPPRSAYGPGHRGVDLRARPGQPVLAVAAGRVSFTGRVAGRGVLSIELHGTGRPPLRTTYEPVLPVVEKGERVVAGQIVGRLTAGPYHCRTACLHWGLRRGDAYLDPLSLLPPWLLRGGPSRLLPVFRIP